ncbi:MAG: hypothetical protein DI604_15060 [Delftia acidovorans]|nr:MAG: hypothetical protein DI604_15060 [Delftia acidovorans]
MLVTFAAVGLLPFLSGCPQKTSNEKFLEMTRSCISPQLLGPSGEIVFFGPSEYRPGDVFKRAADASGTWRYSAEFEYAAQVEGPTLAKVVKPGSVPVECKLTQDASVQFDLGAEGNATLTKAAVPLSASAGLSLKNGSVSSISAHKLFVDSVPYLQPYTESIASLPAGCRGQVFSDIPIGDVRSS